VHDAAGKLVGIRGSFEGPPFVGKAYRITDDSQSAQKEGETDVGIWTCLMKTPAFSVLQHGKSGRICSVGNDPAGMRAFPEWFAHPGDSYIYKEHKAGGARRTRRKI